MFINDKEKLLKDLYRAMDQLDGYREIERFMTDLCTPKELQAFGERWAIAQLLEEGKMSYRDISKETGASTTTVARVARFLNQEPYKGYKIILDKMIF